MSYALDNPSPAPLPEPAWLRSAAERFASVSLLLLIATGASLAKGQAYRVLLGCAILSATVAAIGALLARWGRPMWGAARALFAAIAVLFLAATILGILSAAGLIGSGAGTLAL